MPLGAFAKTGGINAEDLDPAPRFPGGINFLRVIVSTTGADHGHFMALPDQGRRQFLQVLPRGRHLRIKNLVKEKYFHSTGNTRPPICFSNIRPADFNLDGTRNRLVAHQHEITATARTG